MELVKALAFPHSRIREFMEVVKALALFTILDLFHVVVVICYFFNLNELAKALTLLEGHVTLCRGCYQASAVWPVVAKDQPYQECPLIT